MAYGTILGQTSPQPNCYSKEETLSSNTKILLSLSSSSVPDDAFNKLFTSVSNGKQLVASAITDMGIITSQDATYQTMANNIRNISVSGWNYQRLQFNKYSQAVHIPDYNFTQGSFTLPQGTTAFIFIARGNAVPSRDSGSILSDFIPYYTIIRINNATDIMSWQGETEQLDNPQIGCAFSQVQQYDHSNWTSYGSLGPDLKVGNLHLSYQPSNHTLSWETVSFSRFTGWETDICYIETDIWIQYR